MRKSSRLVKGEKLACYGFWAQWCIPIMLTEPANEKFVGVREKETVELSTPMMSAEGNLKLGARGMVKKRTIHSLARKQFRFISS